MKNFINRSDELFLGRYKGSVLEYAWLSTIFLSVVLIGEVLFWFYNREIIWYSGWLPFWNNAEFRTFAVFIILSLSFSSWLIIPNVLFLIGRTSSGYISYINEDKIKWVVLFIFTVITFIVTAVVSPALTIYLFYLGVKDWVFFLVGGIPGITIVIHLIRYGKRLLQRRKLGHPDLISFRNKLRPMNSKIINMDVGALAPRLSAVSSALLSWSKVAEGSAPTAKIYWNTISGPRSELPTVWNRNLKNLAFTNIEEFRRSIALLLGTEASGIVFVTSTTRALDLILSTYSNYDAIITSNLEHPSEEFVFTNHARKYKAKIVKIDLFEVLKQSNFKKILIENIVNEVKKYKKPIFIMSEVPYSMGLKLPISEISGAIRIIKNDAIIIYDGAHSVGQYEINLESRDYDYFIFSGHKWLFGPASLGILVIGSKIKNNSKQMQKLQNEAFESLAFPGSKLGEAGSTISIDPFVGLAETIALMPPPIRQKVFRNIVALRILLEKMIEQMKNVKILTFSNLTDDYKAHGIVNIQRKNEDLGYDSLVRVRDYLESEKDIILKVIKTPLSLRLCIPFYIEQYEIERLALSLEDAFGMQGL